MMNYRKCNTEELFWLNTRAREQDFNRQLDEDALRKKVDPTGTHVLYPLMVHEHRGGQPCEPHVRARVLVKVLGTFEPVPVQLDISVEEFAALREAEEVDV